MKSFKEIFLEKIQEGSGVYVSGEFKEDLEAKIKQFASENKVPNIMTKTFHTTIMYSKYFDYKEVQDVQYTAKPKKFTVFESNGDRVLTIEFESEDLVNRHNELMKIKGATYDYDEYIPHMTISYNIGNFDETKLDIKDVEHIDFTVVKEIGEKLDPDYSA